MVLVMCACHPGEMRGTILPVFVWKLNKTPAEGMQDYWGGLIQPLIQPLGADSLFCQWLIEPGFSSWKPAAPNPCSRCAKERVGWSFDWCVFSVVRMLARYPFFASPSPHPSPPSWGRGSMALIKTGIFHVSSRPKILLRHPG